MNILSFDIEEWCIEKDFGAGNKEAYAKYDAVLDHILELLNRESITATFFCLGKMATDFPHVIRKIASQGHEIGSHSNAHLWINKMTPAEFKKDTITAIKNLEDLTGEKVKSFRAPAFSIGENNKWALEILSECGIENDSSIFPGVRDFGGLPTFNEISPCTIEYNGCHLTEFPIPLYDIPIIHKALAYSGGGYFRLLPLAFVKYCMNLNSTNTCYFHIEDFLPKKSQIMSRSEYEEYFKEPGPFITRYIRHIKSNIGRTKSMAHFEKLLTVFSFGSIASFNQLGLNLKTINL